MHSFGSVDPATVRERVLNAQQHGPDAVAALVGRFAGELPRRLAALEAENVTQWAENAAVRGRLGTASQNSSGARGTTSSDGPGSRPDPKSRLPPYRADPGRYAQLLPPECARSEG